MGIGSAAPFNVTGSRPPSAAESTRAPMRSNGSSTRCIGRLRRLAAPAKGAGGGRAGTAPQHQPAAGAGVSEIEQARRRPKAADAYPMNAPNAFALALDLDAQHPHGFTGIE